MEIRNDGLKLQGWQFLVMVFVGLLLIAAITVTTISGQRAAVEQQKIVQQEKSERGHWIWGRWQDVAKKQEQ